MKKHDENKDLKLFSEIGKVETGTKTLKISTSATVGIRMWGRIDYLTHYCGYVLIFDNFAGVGINTPTASDSYNYKKNKKDYQDNYKTKRNNKRSQL